MARQFAGFTPDQLGKIDPSLQGMQSDEQQKLIAANPALAARVGKMAEMAQQRIGMAQGGYAKKGYAVGGVAEQDVNRFNAKMALQNNKDNTPQTAYPEAGIQPYQMQQTAAPMQTGQPAIARQLMQKNNQRQQVFMNQNKDLFDAAQNAQKTIERDVLKQFGLNKDDPQAVQAALERNPDLNMQLNQAMKQAYNNNPDMQAAMLAQQRFGRDIALGTNPPNRDRQQDSGGSSQVNVTGPVSLSETALSDPTAFVTQRNPELLSDRTGTDQLTAEGTGAAPDTVSPITPMVGVAAPDTVVPTTPDTETYTATTTAADTREQLEDFEGVTRDTLAREAVGETGTVSDKALADENLKVAEDRIQQVEAGERAIKEQELVEAKGKDLEAIKTEVAQSEALEKVVAEQGVVSPEEIPEPAQIAEADMAQAEAITADKVADDAIMVAEKLAKFSVDDGTLAEFKEGRVEAQETVQGQLTSLMRDFDDGTPAWAAGAIRAANAAMASRGLGGSSMAGAAVLQAAMESAIPIAKSDADTFAKMKLDNLGRQQQISLQNAAAQQKVELKNFDAAQQAALQNSTNAFSLQETNLSNMQSTMIANAQIRSALQGKNLDNQQQVNLSTAARYAEMANLNLNNRQQAALANSNANLQINLGNLSAKSQAYVTNANLAASLQGKVLDNDQQAAITNAAKYSDAANLTFTAEQQTQLHNSQLMQTIGLAELDTKQASVLQNAATYAAMDITNLNNRQQAMVQNSKAFLELDLANMTNEQQAAVFKQQQVIQSLFNDQAADNAAKQFNASSENQTEQFFADLAASVSMNNQTQKNTMARFNAGEVNAINTVLAQEQNRRDEFNSNLALVIAQGNTEWMRKVVTTDTAELNEASRTAAMEANDFTMAGYNAEIQRERDVADFIFRAAEGLLNRELQLTLQTMREDSANERAAGQGFGDIFSTVFDAVLSGYSVADEDEDE